MTPGKVNRYSEFKKLSPNNFEFYKTLKIHKKNIIKSVNFFVFVSYCTKTNCSKKKPQLKVDMDDVHEAH